MTHAFVNIIVPFANARADAVDQTLETFVPDLRKGGEDASELRKRLRGSGLHFMTVTVVRGDAGQKARLVIEMSVDGGKACGYDILNDRLGVEIDRILKAADIARTTTIKALLRRYDVVTGQGLFDVPGLNFCGTPGMTVARILKEVKLGKHVRDYIDNNVLTGSHLQRLLQIRADVEDPKHELADMLVPEPVAPIPTDPGDGFADLGKIFGLALGFTLMFLWPLLPILVVAIVLAVLGAGCVGRACESFSIVPALLTLFTGLGLSVIAVVIFLVCLWRAIRGAEKANTPDDSLPDPTVLADVIRHEDWCNQNHLAAISVQQYGWARFFSLRIAFWIIGWLAKTSYRPGYLSDIGTIHYARWVWVPGTNKLLFLSNYGGSWESYLEDFITKAPLGLTGAWSGTTGFPRSENIFLQGAADGERFKRWARRQQQPSRFWYTAYPDLTTARVRANAALRQGLATATTEDEAEAWFSLMGSALRPPAMIEAGQVQTLFFGGLKTCPNAACLIVSLPPAPAKAKLWLRGLLPHITFGDGTPPEVVHILSLSASGLEKLSLEAETRGQFSAIFRMGMRARAEILADTGSDKPANWRWGPGPYDAAINIYGHDAGALKKAVAAARANLVAQGGAVLRQIDLTPHDLKTAADARSSFSHEPFGFTDGVSQPIVRGTQRWSRDSDRIHTVEPGEFLLGYPDNRGTKTFSPTVPATADPRNVLTVAAPTHSRDRMIANFSASGANADRDFGCNGSFLVIRQLEQDAKAFDGYCQRTAAALANEPDVPKLQKDQLAQWVGAKIVGRWKDGTSLVRFPNRPGNGWPRSLGEIATKPLKTLLTTPVAPDNEFLFGKEDPRGERCPYGAHIRRANPRDSFKPGSEEQLSISNRHRILRRGRNFRDDDTREVGLLFMCLNGDIQRQFEFVQQTWITARQFHGLNNEVDPLLSRGGTTARLTVPTPNGPVQFKGAADFVTVIGGEYFFMPGKRALEYLC